MFFWNRIGDMGFFLEARAEILTKISLGFWEIWRHQNDILKLTDHFQLCSFKLKNWGHTSLEVVWGCDLNDEAQRVEFKFRNRVSREELTISSWPTGSEVNFSSDFSIFSVFKLESTLQIWWYLILSWSKNLKKSPSLDSTDYIEFPLHFEIGVICDNLF